MLIGKPPSLDRIQGMATVRREKEQGVERGSMIAVRSSGDTKVARMRAILVDLQVRTAIDTACAGNVDRNCP